MAWFPWVLWSPPIPTTYQCGGPQRDTDLEESLVSVWSHGLGGGVNPCPLDIPYLTTSYWPVSQHSTTHTHTHTPSALTCSTHILAMVSVIWKMARTVVGTGVCSIGETVTISTWVLVVTYEYLTCWSIPVQFTTANKHTNIKILKQMLHKFMNSKLYTTHKT